MLHDLMLGRVALWCGFLMLFGFFGDRSSWVRATNKTVNTVTDAAIYNAVATASGGVALPALAVALNTRPRDVIPVVCLLAAIAAFGLSIFVSGLRVWARLQGEVWFYGTGALASDNGDKWVAHPARGPFVSAFMALLGELATLGLVITWVREAHRSRHITADSVQPEPVHGNA